MTGFDVVTANLRTSGNTLDLTAADLAATKATWERGTADRGAVFGTSECADAFAALREALCGMLSGGKATLAAHGNACVATADAYGHGDRFEVPA